jgi:hypothetical protein
MGTIEWWPGGTSVNTHQLTWEDFAERMEKLPSVRSTKKKKTK